MPGIDGDGAQLDRIEKSEQVTPDHSRLLLAPLSLDQLYAHFRRRRFRSLLLIKAFAANTVGKPLENEGPVQNCRKDEVGDPDVVPHYIAFRVLLLRKEDFVEVGNL